VGQRLEFLCPWIFVAFRHGVLVWWGNFWLESAISNEASFRTSGVAFWGWSPIVSALYEPIY
jgi:hypothetical protein